MFPSRWFAAALGLLLAGCDGSAPDPEAAAPEPPAASAPADAAPPTDLDAAWQGVLPCADCDGIQTRLRLLADGGSRRFELQETYLAAEGGELFETSGEWTQESAEFDGESAVVYRLESDSASRWFRVLPDGSLEQLDARDRANANGVAHRLQRM